MDRKAVGKVKCCKVADGAVTSFEELVKSILANISHITLLKFYATIRLNTPRIQFNPLLVHGIEAMS